MIPVDLSLNSKTVSNSVKGFTYITKDSTDLKCYSERIIYVHKLIGS